MTGVYAVMTSQSPHQLYVNLLKIPRARFAEPTQWDQRNRACIDDILQHVSTWTATSRRGPGLVALHELCQLKHMRTYKHKSWEVANDANPHSKADNGNYQI